LSPRIVYFQDLGLRDYKETWDYQEELFAEIMARKTANRKRPPEAQQPSQDHLLFCEHPHVYTLGKSGMRENLLVSDARLRELEATFYHINRGGDITYHGPGQLVGYPILNLDHFFPDIRRYLRYLEEIFIRLLADYGLRGQRSATETGVWLDVGLPTARKICALGVRTSRWITMHGWAFNVNTDLSYFQHIVPCGIHDKGVTSLAAELGRPVPLEEVKEKARYYFQTLFEATLQPGPA
jgi:lipoyl(octanoyl) transferase